ncbi:MAG: hypothetical protein RBS37_00145 [Bacteroidales bacterium]|nr:hypothetical protein [Bacteroidales bacterium]
MKLLYSIFFIILIGCNSGNHQSSEIPQSGMSDSIWIEMTLYEPHYEMHALLDSIIKTLETCPSPKGKIIELVISIEYQDYGLMMDIETISDYHWNYTLSSGLFDYKNSRFYYSGPNLEELFIETDSSMKMKFQNPQKMVFDIDDRVYKWVYAIKDGCIEGILVKDCQRVWVNRDYFPGEG